MKSPQNPGSKMGIEEIRNIKARACAPKEKKKYVIPKKSAKKIKQEAEEKELRGGDDTLLEKWFKARRKEMTGICQHCGGRSCRDQHFRSSIAHILPKRFFKSVATHPLNWIELCFWNKSCHTNLDNNVLDITDLNCFDTVIERFIEMYPSIDRKERKYIPNALLQYLNIDK
jgi:hypothetical protein